MASGISGSNFNVSTTYFRPRNHTLRSLTLHAGHWARIGVIRAWETLTMNMARLALLYTGLSLTFMKSSSPQYCFASRKSATSGKAGGLKKVEPLKADRSCEPLKAVRL